MGSIMSGLYGGYQSNVDDLSQDETNQDAINQDIQELKDQLKQKDNTIELLRNENNAHIHYSEMDIDSCGFRAEIDAVKKEKNYEYLVMSGGGIKGICYCGVLETLDKMGILYDQEDNLKLKGVAGTSAGSIVACLLAIGFTPKEIRIVLDDMDFNKLLDDKFGYVRDTYNFIEHYGVCPGKYIEKLLGDLIKSKTGDADYTIAQLYEEKGVELVIVTTDMLHNKSIYLNPLNDKECNRNIPIRKAVRMSMSIPFLYEPVNYEGQMCVDGGVLDNYAIHVFDGKYPGHPDGLLNLLKPNPRVLGLKILTNSQLEKNKTNDITGIFNYSISYIDLFLTDNEKRVMTPSNILRSIQVVTDDFPLSEFDLTEEQKMNLIDSGRKYTEEYFNC